MKLLITHSLTLLLHIKSILFKFGDFMSLGNFAENIYNGSVSLDPAKQEQRKMLNMLEKFIDYNLIKGFYKN